MNIIKPISIVATCSLTAIWFSTGAFAAQEKPISAEHARVVENYGKLPLSFEARPADKGATAQFLARGRGYTLMLSASEASLALPDSANNSSSVVRMKLSGANVDAVATPFDRLPGNVSYFRGNDPSQWRKAVPTYGRVKFEGVYPGIDLVYYGTQGKLEYDFLVAPGVDAGRIALSFHGAKNVRVDEDGNLVVSNDDGKMLFHKPVVYQLSNGERQPVVSRYDLHDNQVRFVIAAYDTSRELVIDPVLSYATYLGGGPDAGLSVAVDKSGNAYVTGRTSANDFPTTSGALDSIVGGFQDAFISKIDPTGENLVWSTYLGGSSSEYDVDRAGIAVNDSGDVFVTGQTASSNFPTTPGALRTNQVSGADAFVTRIQDGGSNLVYSTYLGGSSDDEGAAIAVDALDNAYVTGQTCSTNFPTTAGAAESSTTNNNCFVFVAKLNSDGSALVYSTFLGSETPVSFAEGIGYGIALDSSMSAYVVGRTDNANYPTTPGSFQPVFGDGIDDGFITKLSPSGSNIVYSSFIGGNDGNGESARAVAVDSGGNAHVAGTTSANDFPVTVSALSTNRSGIFSAFLAKVSPSGSNLLYSTYFAGTKDRNGSIAESRGLGVAVDIDGNSYMTGSTSATNLPTKSAFQSVYGGGSYDAYVAKFNPTASGNSSLVYASFLGGFGSENSPSDISNTGIAVDTNGNAYVVGNTTSDDFPFTPGVLQTNLNGSANAFVAKIASTGVNPSEADLSILKSDSPDPVIVGSNLTYTIVVTNLGTATATGVTVTDTLPSSVTFVSASVGCTNNNGVVTCGMADLDNGQFDSVQIVVIPSTVGNATNIAIVSSFVNDPDSANNTALAITTVQQSGGGGGGSLTGTLSKVKEKCKTKNDVTTCKLGAGLALLNSGNSEAPATHVRFFLSSDTSYNAGADTLLGEATTKTIKPGKSGKAKLKAVTSASSAGQYILAVDDSGAVLASYPIPNT